MGVSGTKCGSFKRWCQRKFAQAPFCNRWLPGLNGPRGKSVRRALLGGMLAESEADSISTSCKACQLSKFPQKNRAVSEGFGADYSGPFANNGGHFKGCSKKHLVTKKQREAQQRLRQNPGGELAARSIFFQPRNRAPPAVVPMDVEPAALPADVEPAGESEIVKLTEMDHREAFIDHMMNQSTKTAPHVPPYVMRRGLEFAYRYIMGEVDWPDGELPTLNLDDAKTPLGERTTLHLVDDMVDDIKFDGWKVRIIDPSKLGEGVAVACCFCGSSKCRAKRQHTVHLALFLCHFIFIK
jgi:hypothetical protein